MRASDASGLENLKRAGASVGFGTDPSGRGGTPDRAWQASLRIAAQMLSATAAAKSITFTRPDPKDRFPPYCDIQQQTAGFDPKPTF